MENPMNINSGVYNLAATTTSDAITLEQSDINLTRVIVTNNGTTDAFVVSGVTSPTAVFPNSATVPIVGSTVAGGSTQVFHKDPTHKYIAAIMRSGTADLTFKLGSGE